jgi:hypothetical protein
LCFLPGGQISETARPEKKVLFSTHRRLGRRNTPGYTFRGSYCATTAIIDTIMILISQTFRATYILPDLDAEAPRNGNAAISCRHRNQLIAHCLDCAVT